MKIFISHSSRDRWVAHRLSDDLRRLGAQTFLDAKDIERGDSVDGSVRQHLKESDEILILWSPAALKSDWVRLEMGAAFALEKRLVPILLYVGVNELPDPLRQSLACDLNDVERYYAEVNRRLQDRAPSEPAGSSAAAANDAPAAPVAAVIAAAALDAAPAPPRRTFDVGDVVRIPDHPQPDLMGPSGPVVTWEPAMTAHVGKKAEVVAVGSYRSVRLSPGEGWWWAMDWLEPVEPTPPDA